MLSSSLPIHHDSPQAVVGGGDVMVMMKDTEGARALLRFLASPRQLRSGHPGRHYFAEQGRRLVSISERDRCSLC